MPKLDAALVAELRGYVPLIRALRAAGFTHTVYGSVYYGGVDHSWMRRDGERAWTNIDLDADGFHFEHIAPLGAEAEAGEYRVKTKGRLTPERTHMLLAVYGILSLDARPLRAFRLALSDPGAYVKRDRGDDRTGMETLTHWQIRALERALSPYDPERTAR